MMRRFFGGGRAVVAILGLCVGWLFISHQRAEARAAEALEARDAALVRLDSIAAEEAAARARADGWEVVFGVDDPVALRDSLAAIDSTRAADLAESNVRVEQLTQIVAAQADSVEALGAVEEPAAVDSAGQVHGLWGGEIRRPLFQAQWQFRLPEAALRMNYRASCPGNIMTARTADSRIVVFARGDSPTCTLHIGNVFIDPPAPVVQRQPPNFLQRNWHWVGVGGILLGLAIG